MAVLIHNSLKGSAIVTVTETVTVQVNFYVSSVENLNQSQDVMEMATLVGTIGKLL